METVTLAQKTILDLNDKPINLSLEEKGCRIGEMLEMVANLESNYADRGIVCSPIFFESVFVPNYIKLKPDRLRKMFVWIRDNYKPYGKFPIIPDFEEARRETSDHIVDTFDPIKKNEDFVPYNAEVKKMYADLIKKFTPPMQKMGVREDGTVKKESQIDLCKRMAKEKKIYSLVRQGWIPKADEEKTGGYFVYPENQIPKEDK